jgi:hypothetical protein
MNEPRFLMDENVPPLMPHTLRTQGPGIDFLCVGEPGAPPPQTSDPDLLLAAETLQRLLVTLDRKTMPGHLRQHFHAGQHTCGVVLLRNGFPLARYVHELLLIWGASTAAEWVDMAVYLP